MSLKQQAIDAISKLPDSATVEDMMYRLLVIDKIQAGLKDADTGNTKTSDQLRKEIESWK